MSPGRIDPARSGAVPGGGRQQTSRALLVYTGGRVVAFLVSLAFLRLLGFHTYALFVGALLLSALVSLVLFRRQRAAVSQALMARPRRDALTRPSSTLRHVSSGGDTDDDLHTEVKDPYSDDDDTGDGDGDDNGDGDVPTTEADLRSTDPGSTVEPPGRSRP